MLTTADRTEMFDDATCVDLVDRYDDVLALPLRDRELFLARAAATIPPSDAPAVQLREDEPTDDDLVAIEDSSEEEIDARLATANILAALEARHRDLRRLRAELPAVALVDVFDDDNIGAWVA